jgi:hypothetical protein
VDDATQMLHGGWTEKSPLVFTPKSSSACSKVLTDDIGQDQGMEKAILFLA